MPVFFSRAAGASNPKTLFVDTYVSLLDRGLLSPTSASLGFKTYVAKESIAPIFTSEENYLASFRQTWARLFGTAPFEADQDITEVIGPVKFLSAVNEVEEAMENLRRPSLLINGLPSVQEDGAPSTTNAIANTASINRDTAKLNMLRRMRPPPLQYAWTFYHDKHTDAHTYEGRLTVLLENIITLKPFWEAYNRFPLDALKMKDSVHFFKRGVKPVWEDPRNVKGGAWTFRVPKDKSDQTWKEILMLAIGEQFADIIEPKDDLCGMSLSVRFNSNLITIWNRDGTAQKTIDGILAVVMKELSPEIMPKEGSYYYKRHSEHAGFNEVVSKAAEAAAAANGKIEEAKVKEDEADIALIQEMEVEDVEKA